jgi:hypothetical protein
MDEKERVSQIEDVARMTGLLKEMEEFLHARNAWFGDEFTLNASTYSISAKLTVGLQLREQPEYTLGPGWGSK